MGRIISLIVHDDMKWRGEQRWRSGESARLPPMCPGFDSWARHHMWVEFIVGSLLCSERFFSGYYGFPLSSKTNISKFQFDPGMHGHLLTSSCELLGAPWVNKLQVQLQLATKFAVWCSL